MAGLDSLFLARLQFAFTVGFHIVFPAFSIGLAAFLAVLEGLWLKTGRQVYLDLFRYWLHTFSIVFGMGVVSGLVMSYEFGTNWARFSQKVGPILGPLLGYEVMTAFFLEAGFLGIMLFGMNRVGPKLHFFATCVVSLGTLISMSWILASNSWMQTPQGYTMEAGTGRFIPHDWWAIIFNPSFPFRLVHMALAAFLSVALLVGGVGAWHLLHARRAGQQPTEAVRIMFSMAMWMAAIVAPIQILAGDTQGLNTLKYQPAKIAAMEGDWESESYAPELLFGIPDMHNEVTRYRIAIPYAGSLILTHSLSGKVPGIKDYPRDQRAPSYVVFFSFRIMVLLGMLMAALGFYSVWLRWRGRLWSDVLLQRAALIMAPAGFIALLCGWITTEVGRQPFTVYGLLRTADSVSPVPGGAVAGTLVSFVIVYFIVFASGISILLRGFMKEPHVNEAAPDRHQPQRAAAMAAPISDTIEPSRPTREGE